MSTQRKMTWDELATENAVLKAQLKLAMDALHEIVQTTTGEDIAACIIVDIDELTDTEDGS